uniref:FHA domain-containing protein n=1 Tax=Glossina morsitans morsitans TaxID=37546 RepID=A0A905AVW7_GLOMM
MENFKVPTKPTNSAKPESLSKISNIPTIEQTSEVTFEELPGDKAQCNPYKIPPWSSTPSKDRKYSFEILKSGQIIEKIEDLQEKAFWTFGRLPENDIEMAHPTISRFHAILQYRSKKEINENVKSSDTLDEIPEGWYVYDLDSTHGTFLNKQRIPTKVFIRIRVGHMLRLGASTRSYILQGPVEDEEPESDLSVTELKIKRKEELEALALEKQRKMNDAEERARSEGCSWGMGEDADEETDLSHNPYATTNNEELFLDDPKKTLRGYFEREGLQLEYKCDEMSAGSFVCRVELPIDDSNGRPIVAEVVHKGRKKECVVQCALEACRILDRHGVLRQANQEPQKRKMKNPASDSDDDEFWDRTGDVARKKQRKANINANVTLTHDDLLKKESNLEKNLREIEAKIASYQEKRKRIKDQNNENGEDLESYLKNLNEAGSEQSKIMIRKLRLEEQHLKTEQQKVRKLIQITKPADIPCATASQIVASKAEMNKKLLPMIGKRNQFSKFKIITATTHKVEKPNINKALASDEEEMEEDDCDEEKKPQDNRSNEPKENEHKGIIGEGNVMRILMSEKEELKDDDKLEAERLHLDRNNTAHENVIESKSSGEKTKHYGPSVMPTNILAKSCSEKDIAILGQESEGRLVSNEIQNKNGNKTHAPLDSSKESNCSDLVKRRHRSRHRRQEVDIDDDDEHYDPTGKYAKWIPPENQTGDGITELNKKYGY